MKLNCWERKQCGLQPGGPKTRELGICPVSVETKAHSMHGGVNGGRVCWAIQRKLTDEVQCKKDQNLDTCLQCNFYAEVRAEEGKNYITQPEILAKLR